MRSILSVIAIVLFAISSSVGQDHCFEDCMDNMKTSTVPFPNKSRVIIQGLIGCQAPDFEVETLDSALLKLSDLKGNVVVMNFWFEACPPCIAELPALNRLAEEYAAEDVVFIAFGRDGEESIRGFLQETEFIYEHVAIDQQLIEKYCIVAGWPTNMVLDKEGVLRQIFSGGPTDERAQTEAYDKMKPTIEEYLNK